jgi:hypothetical protein
MEWVIGKQLFLLKVRFLKFSNLRLHQNHLDFWVKKFIDPWVSYILYRSGAGHEDFHFVKHEVWLIYIPSKRILQFLILPTQHCGVAVSVLDVFRSNKEQIVICIRYSGLKQLQDILDNSGPLDAECIAITPLSKLWESRIIRVSEATWQSWRLWTLKSERLNSFVWPFSSCVSMIKIILLGLVVVA